MPTEYYLILDCLGFRTPTTAHIADDYITTHELSIQGLCATWRKHFSFPNRRRVKLLMAKDIYKAVCRGNSLIGGKSARDIFEEQGFICVEMRR